MARVSSSTERTSVWPAQLGVGTGAWSAGRRASIPPPARGLPGPGRRGPGAAARKAQPGHVDTAGEGRLRSRDLLWITCPGYGTVSAFPESSTRLCTTRPEETRKPRGTRTPQPGSPGGRLRHAAPTSVAFSERSHASPSFSRPRRPASEAPEFPKVPPVPSTAAAALAWAPRPWKGAPMGRPVSAT